MSGRVRRVVGLLAWGPLAAVGCSPAQRAQPARPPSPVPSHRELTAEQQALQVLGRLAFGPRPGDLAAVERVGVDAWVESQLHPDAIPDAALDAALAFLPLWRQAPQKLAETNPPQDLFIRNLRRERGVADNAAFRMSDSDSVAFKAVNDRANALGNQFLAGKVMRAQLSERQLLEVMTDFWENHFSVFAGKMPTRFSLLEWDRDVIRPRALGNFRDLLGAVAHSAPMLFYLDNWQSGADSLHLTLPEFRAMEKAGGRRPPIRRRGGLNENYGRELLELHTLGVDGGYTQHDVIDVARALTGWTLQNAREGGGYVFREGMHDAEAKVVLGHRLGPGRGELDGDEVLDIVALHPSTARFIATKLVRRFVSDVPPAALVERVAATFRETRGDIPSVLHTIYSSAEFHSRAAYRAKLKSPFELAVSARRVLRASPDTTPRTAQAIARLGQPLFGKLTPNGWPETGDQWMNTGALLDRINFGFQVTQGRLAAAPVEQWPPWAALEVTSLERQVDGIVEQLLGGDVSPETRAVLISGQNPLAPRARPAERPSLRDLIGLALGSPEFQRR